MNFKPFMIVVLGLISLGSMSPVVADPLDFLHLSDDQREAIAGIRAEKAGHLLQLKKKLAHARVELEFGLKSDISENNLLELFENTRSIEAELSQLRFQNILAIRRLLTLEQRSKMTPRMIKDKAKTQRKLKASRG